MRLEWMLGKISVCFSWIDKCLSGIWAWCVDAIVDELGSFTLNGFSERRPCVDYCYQGI